jgi:type III secretion system needle length determinant
MASEFVQVVAEERSTRHTIADIQSGRQPTDARSTPVSASERPLHALADRQSARVPTDDQSVRSPATSMISDSGSEPSHPASGSTTQPYTRPQVSDTGGQIRPDWRPAANTQERAIKASIGQDEASRPSGIAESRLNESSSSNSSALPTGDRILQGLGQHSATVENTPTPATSATQTSDRVEQIERLGERLAQRILVSDRSQVGDSEVRIQLRESVLQGGEIRLRQEQGQLVVSIQVPSADLARQLSGQTDSLQQTLANRLETSVRVEVQVVGARDAGNDANPGDGRSRNRRDPWDSYEPEP